MEHTQLQQFNEKDLKQWIRSTLLNRQIEERLKNHVSLTSTTSRWPVNPRVSYISMALGHVFKPDEDFCYLLPGDLLTALMLGIRGDILLKTILQRIPEDTSKTGISPVHFSDPLQHIFAATGINTSHIREATGLASALNTYDSDGVVFVFADENDFLSGDFYEAVLAADKLKLPVAFMVRISKNSHSLPPENFSQLSHTYLTHCDGNHLEDSVSALAKTHQLIHLERQPVILVIDEQFSSRQLEDAFSELLILSGRFSSHQLLAIHSEVAQATQTLFIPYEKHNEVDSVQFPTTSAIKVFEAKELEPHENHKTISYREAIQKALSKQMKENGYLFYLQKENNYAGSNSLIINLRKKHGHERVLEMPFSATQLLSMASGMGQYNQAITTIAMPSPHADFLWPTLHILQEIAFRNQLTGAPTHLILRVPSGGYLNQGPFGSQTLDGIFTGIPGIRVVAPAFADDAAGLLHTAINTPGITIFAEAKALYDDPIASAQVHPESTVPFGKGKKRRRGKDLTIITYGNPVHLALEAAQRISETHHFEVEVFDIRSILPLDKSGILKRIRKTGRALVVTENYLFGNVGADIAAMISEEAFSYLKAPVIRLGSVFVPVPYQAELESKVLPSVHSIVEAALDILEY